MATLTPPLNPTPWSRENSDEDFSDEEDRPTRKGGNEDDQESAVEKAAEKLAAEKLAAEKPAAGKSVADEPRENTIPNGEQIGEWLKDVITNHRKGLRKMYGETEEELDKCLKALIEQGEEMARRLIDYMKCTAVVAKDLTVLTLYDVAILIGMFQC